jgi:hypothetical protein
MITTIYLYVVDGEWYYSAWWDKEYDHDSEVPKDNLQDAYQWVKSEFPGARIEVRKGE